MVDSFSHLCDGIVTDVELRQVEKFHQARVIIQQIEKNCNDAWEALEKMEEIKNKSDKFVGIEYDVKCPILSRIQYSII